MPPELYTEQTEGYETREFGYRVHQSEHSEYSTLPGYKAKDVIIMEMIEANQILRDQLLELRDEAVRWYQNKVAVVSQNGELEAALATCESLRVENEELKATVRVLAREVS